MVLEKLLVTQYVETGIVVFQRALCVNALAKEVAFGNKVLTFDMLQEEEKIFDFLGTQISQD